MAGQSTLVIERLSPPGRDVDMLALADLLVDAVKSGAAVSFLAPLSRNEALEWWKRTLNGAHPRSVFLAARRSGAIIGTVQMHPVWAPNQPHRADIAKLIVRSDCQGEGVGASLMRAAEHAARDAGFTLLTLDARRDGAADRLYRRLGWTVVGAIPRFALNPERDGWHDTVIFYKELTGAPPVG